jgi:hypothetical protein
MYIDLSLFVVIVLVLLALSINVAKVLMVKQSLDDFSKELVRTAEVNGEIGHWTDEREEALKRDLGISPEITWEQPRGRIDLNEKIALHLSADTEVGIGGYLKLPLELKSSATGYSEVYWKNETST